MIQPRPSIPGLILSHLKEETKTRLKRVLHRALNALGDVRRIPTVEVKEAPHKTIVEAIAATNQAIGECRSETRERNKWLYLVIGEDDNLAKVVEFFDQPAEAPVIEGRNGRGMRMAAVWDARNHGLTTTSEPTFI